MKDIHARNVILLNPLGLFHLVANTVKTLRGDC